MIIKKSYSFDLSFPQHKGEKQWPQIVAVLVGALAGVTEGLLLAWTSPFLVKISQDKVNYNISEEEGSYFSIIQPLSMILASPIFSKLCDVIGRKRTLLLISVPQMSSWLLAAFAKHVYVFYAARVCAGVANACFYSALPIYIGEIANPTVRGTYGNSVATSLYLGVLLITIIGSYLDVQLTSFVCLTFPILFIIFFSMMPETPYYYIMKGDEENAKQSLRFLKRMENVDEEYVNLKQDVDRQLSESKSWKCLVQTISNRKALAAAIFLRISQQLAGYTVFLNYTQFIFQKSGGNLSHAESSIIYTSLNLFLNIIVSLFIVEKLGRRKCFLWSLLTTAVTLFIMATYFYLDSHVDIDLSSFQWIPLVGMLMYLIFSSFGLAVIPTLMLSELFSARHKAKAMAILLVVFGIASCMGNAIFYYLNTVIGFYCPFYFFVICNLISSLISYYIVPETKGKTLEEIQQILRDSSVEKKIKEVEDTKT